MFKPYSSIDENTGKCTGIGFDATKQLLRAYNIEIQASCAVPARIFRSLSSGIVDLSLNIKSTSAIQDKVTFTTIPFDALTLNFYSNPNISHDNNKIAVIRGYDYHGFRNKLIQQGFELVDVSNVEDAVRIFANERTKYLLSYEGPFKAYIKNEKSKKALLTLTEAQAKLLVSIPTHYAISKTSPHHDALVKAFKEIDKVTPTSKYHLDAFK
jgi:polar amino acid transport system substrate-binding protein